MIIKKIHIENFGKLSDFDHEFKTGVNTILEDNGWGKSTLVSFIRVMFYGPEGDGKRKLLRDSDRGFYRPWNGGTFGGTIEFEAGGKDYILTRVFGATAKADTFDLRDALTMKESEDYSPEDLGERLFGLDRDSYKKTAYIDHGNIKYQGVGSEVGSKVSAIPQADDLGGLDAAKELIKNYLNSHSLTKAKGSLNIQKSRITELEKEIGRKVTLQGRIDDEQKVMSDLRDREKAIKDRRRAFEEEIRSLNKGKERAIAKKVLCDKNNYAKERKAATERALEALGGKVPKNEVITIAEGKIAEMELLSTRLDVIRESGEDARFERLERRYAEYAPTQGEIADKIESMRKVRELTLKIDNYDDKLTDNKNLLDTVLEKGRAAKYEALLSTERKISASKGPIIAGGMLAFLAFVFIVAMYLMFGNELLYLIYPAIFLFAVGIMISVLGLIGKKRALNEQPPEIDEAEAQRLGSEIAELTKAKAEAEESLKREEDNVRNFLSRFNYDYSRRDAEDYLHSIKSELAEYREDRVIRQRRTEELADIEKAGLEASTAAVIALEEIGVTVDPELSFKGSFEEFKGAITKLREKLGNYKHCLEEQEKAEAEFAEYQESHKELTLDTLEGITKTQEEIKNRLIEIEGEMANITEGLDNIAAEKAACNRRISDLDTEMEELSAKEEELAGEKESFDEEKYKYGIVQKSADYLERAKDSLIARYMAPLRCSFEKYYDILNGVGKNGKGSDYLIDTSLGIQKKEQGAFRDIEYLSDGLGDMTGLCMRAALLDVMYKDEKPVVIMDDPFSNLDEENLKWAGAFLETLSKEYQIIYMTCHENRVHQ
jgi:DNA repair exonuclease SbcCD ATPase subunit